MIMAKNNLVKIVTVVIMIVRRNYYGQKHSRHSVTVIVEVSESLMST